ncbi:glycine betaine/L-proline ABC transporter substrate-binding protein ProX [Polaromonas sp.]|uniref:glycine betaine/L-proline ABC transporter substrate-binding protein ProX n=1 Tax=Polaromonas sp. TaxID=1869339 RepID=UPI0013B5C38B|nr:glycine betaine/L-proline ABC transporter substrate-binding protein ProX [Polaromonas sp.]NDP63508.1 glycine betaine/L-proline ABC transporter substrate-binding protein ProX [Polaromonas sp.]
MMINTRNFTRTLVAAGLLALGLAAHAAADLPGKGVKVQPLQSSTAEETFQTLLASRAMQKLGFDVQPIKEVDYPASHIAIANGDATFMANHWDPLHADFYKNAGGDSKLARLGSYVSNAAQGYLIDKKTAEKYNITRIDQLRDPKLAKLFDTTGDGKANLTGCNPGWGCEAVLEHQFTAYKLRDTVTHMQGNYAALIADTLARYKEGKPVLYYTWTPYWLSGVLRPGKEVTWLEVPFTALPDNQGKVDTKLPNGKNYGFPLNTHRIVATKAFVEKYPSAGKLFEVMVLPIGDVNAQNQLMNSGQGSQQDIARHTDGWIKAHQKTFDGWIAQALDVAKT